MEVLMLNQGIFLSSEELLVKVWGYDTEAEIGTVWVYISYLAGSFPYAGNNQGEAQYWLYAGCRDITAVNLGDLW